MSRTLVRLARKTAGRSRAAVRGLHPRLHVQLMCDAERLREYDQDEWRDVVRSLRPDWTDEEMDAKWAEFIEWKRRKEMH